MFIVVLVKVVTIITTAHSHNYMHSVIQTDYVFLDFLKVNSLARGNISVGQFCAKKMVINTHKKQKKMIQKSFSLLNCAF